MLNGWIKLHRKMLDWEWYGDANTMRVFIHLVLSVNHEDNKWKGNLIKRGSCITSYENIAIKLNISIRNVRTAIKHLKSTNELTHEGTKQFSYITINNFDAYNTRDTPSDSQVTNERHTGDTQVTTNKNDKNVKNDKKDKNKKENIVPVETGTAQSNWKPEYGERYIEAFNRLFNRKYQLTPTRVKKLRLRFNTFTPAQMTTALVNLSRSKFHQGKNDNGWTADPDFLIRSDEQVDKWLNIKGGSNEL